MDWLAFAGIVVAIAVPVGLALHAAGRSRSQKNTERIEDHTVRIARLEEKVERVEEEQKLGRTRYHDLRDSLTRYIGDKLNEALDAVRRWRKDG